MNFNQHYFNEESIEEKIGDIVRGGATGAVKAVAQKAGQAALNIARGLTGRMKTIVFEPGWLKVLRPTNQANYQKAINIYSNWKNKKTKLGPKQNFTVIDVRNGQLGKYTADDFTDLLGRYDAKVKATNIQMDAEIPPRMTVYMLNNKGKIIFFDLPIGEDGKKRYYAMGLDNKAERAFTLIHGMRFEDFIMDPSEEAGGEAEKKGILQLTKIPIEKSDYNKLAPKKESNNYYSLKKSNHILSLFDNEVLEEKKDNFLKIKDGDKEIRAVTLIDNYWYFIYKTGGVSKGYRFNSTENSKALTSGELIAVIESPKNSKNWIKASDATQKALKNEIDEAVKNKNKEETPITSTKVKDNGKLYNDVKDIIEEEPSQTKDTDTTDNGWRYSLKNKGVIFLYRNKKDGKYYLSYNEPAKEKAEELIDKYGLEKAPETPTEGNTIWDYLNKLI